MKIDPYNNFERNFSGSSCIGKKKRIKILYHITGYKDSLQFKWLFDAIYNEEDIYVLHIDQKAKESVHADFRNCTGFKSNVIFLPSISVTWGGCGLIDAEWQAICFGLKNDPDWTHIINLSAQDYPLLSANMIRNELAHSWPSNYVLCNDIRRVHWRIRKRRLFHYFERNERRFFTPIPKIKPSDIHVRWVGPWWHILTREFCDWMINDNKAKRYLAFLRSAGMPDEMLIQNIIMDSPFRDNLISCCKHEIVWRRPHEPIQSSARPNVLTMEDLPLLESSTAFFARKFDHGIDREVLECLARRRGFRIPDVHASELGVAS